MLDLCLITQIITPARFHIIIEFIHKRDSGRNIQFENVFLGKIVEVLDQRAQRITMRADENTLSRLDLRGDGFVPVGKKPRYGVLEAFGQRDILR